MKKRLLALLLAAVLVLSLAACNKEPAVTTPETENPSTDVEKNPTEAETQTSETVKEPDPVMLEWYYRGNGIQEDTEAVNEHVNELLHAIPGFEHISVHLNPFVAADYPNAVVLAQTTGEQIDILGSVTLDYWTEVANGTYLDLSELLAKDEYAALRNELPQWLWDAVSLDGAPYMVPNQQRGANMTCLALPVKYAVGLEDDLQALRDTVAENGSADVATLGALMQTIVDNARAIEGTENKFAGYFTIQQSDFDGYYFENIQGYGANVGFIMKNDGKNEVTNLYLSDSFKNACELAAEMKKAGYYHPDGSLAQSLPDMLSENGVCVDFVQRAGDEETISQQLTDAYGFEMIGIPLYSQYFMQGNWGAGGNGVTASSEHPEEALAFLQLINTAEGAEIYNTIVYGLEGEHYEKIDETHIKTLEYDGSQGSGTSYSAHKWIMGNTFNCWLNQACPENEIAIAQEINSGANTITSACMGFRFDSSNISTELEQISAVVQEYVTVLRCGDLGDGWEAHYNEFVTKLINCGAIDVNNEIQSQFDAWSAN